MSDLSVTVAEAFKQFSQVTVSAVRSGIPYLRAPYLRVIHCHHRHCSFHSQLRAYEHGTRARLNQAEDDLRVLRHERDDSLRDLNACKEQTRAWVADVNRWKAEARPAHCPVPHLPSPSPYLLYPPTAHCRQIVRY